MRGQRFVVLIVKIEAAYNIAKANGAAETDIMFARHRHIPALKLAGCVCLKVTVKGAASDRLEGR